MLLYEFLERLLLRGMAQLAHDFVDITPGPAFSRLNRSYDRMFGPVKVFSSVFVFGGIAATYMAAFGAQAQVNPTVAGLDTIFANVNVGPGHLYRP
jgi:hypothetical protein